MPERGEGKEPTKLERDLAEVTKNAKRLKLKDKDLEDYIDDHMTGYGYKRKRTYVEPEDESTRGRWTRRTRDDDDDGT